jgi:hypothetical protein
MRTSIIVLTFLFFGFASADAGLKILGKGDTMRLDSSGLPANMKANYEVMKAKCVKCHTLERAIVSMQTGKAPITGQLFDKNASKSYGIKMLRKPDSNMNKQEVKAVVDLMNYLLEQETK